jgi:hypothetical protein
MSFYEFEDVIQDKYYLFRSTWVTVSKTINWGRIPAGSKVGEFKRE